MTCDKIKIKTIVSVANWLIYLDFSYDFIEPALIVAILLFLLQEAQHWQCSYHQHLHHSNLLHWTFALVVCVLSI